MTSTRIPRVSKRDETEGVQVFFHNGECNPKSCIEYSADTNKLGEFESCAVQGDASLKKQCDQGIHQDAL